MWYDGLMIIWDRWVIILGTNFTLDDWEQYGAHTVETV